MIDPKDLNQKAEMLSEELHAKLGLRGATLAARLGKAGRKLPKRLHKLGQTIVTAQKNVAHPKLAMRADPAPINAAFAEFSRFLKDIDPVERRKTAALRWLAGFVFNLIVVVVLLVLLLRWQGFI